MELCLLLAMLPVFWTSLQFPPSSNSIFPIVRAVITQTKWSSTISRIQLKCDGTQWRTREEVKGKLANAVGSQYSFTLPPNMVQLELLLLMHTPRLPVVDWTDAPANLNGPIHFTERWNLVSACMPSHFKCSLPHSKYLETLYKHATLTKEQIMIYKSTHSFFYNYTVPSHRNITSCRPSPVLSWNTKSGISHPLSVCTLSWLQWSFVLFSLYIYFM
jgi:hypothetical protein